AGYAGTLQSLGADIASEQAVLSSAWQGDTGITYQGWQAQWNQAMEALARAYRRCRRALRQIGVLERPVGDSSDCGTIRVGSFRGRWLDPRHAGPATAADAGD
ncbi:WXG100 family type VII secretion target, partial [Mycobacterium canetti]|uniref:WXG100 family type VII secretion target n=1 Tax=Mycobacterium canetti TaxID=78331 RepID=UPI0032E4BAD7